MIQTYSRTLTLVECGVASVAAPGEQVSGDRHLLKAIPEGGLLAVVDGSGHGSEAALAAKREAETLLVRPGVVGYRLPALETHMTSIFPGDLIIVTTDAIRADFERRLQSDEDLRRIAEYISSACCNGPDGRLVLVARYSGGRQMIPIQEHA